MSGQTSQSRTNAPTIRKVRSHTRRLCKLHDVCSYLFKPTWRTLLVVFERFFIRNDQLQICSIDIYISEFITETEISMKIVCQWTIVSVTTIFMLIFILFYEFTQCRCFNHTIFKMKMFLLISFSIYSKWSDVWLLPLPHNRSFVYTIMWNPMNFENKLSNFPLPLLFIHVG